MGKFAYNNAKNTSTSYTSFELNCGFYFQASYKEDVNPRSQLKSVNKLANELKELMAICKENFQYAQELQKRYHDKYMKLKSYTPSEKV